MHPVLNPERIPSADQTKYNHTQRLLLFGMFLLVLVEMLSDTTQWDGLGHG